MTVYRLKYFSSSIDLNEMMMWHPELLKIFALLSAFCLERQLPLHINSGIRPKYDGISKSATHQTGRAMDVRTKYWTKEQLTDVARLLSGYDNTEKVGAISASDGIRRLAYYHDNHLHIQVAP